MKRAIFALLAVTLVAGSSGCCCLEQLFCHGCGGCGGSCGYGGYYGHEGPACESCGYAGGGHCSSCSVAGGGAYGGQMSDGDYDQASAPRAIASRHPAQGHPLVRKRRDAGGEYEFAAGPPTGGVTYPYYTNRGPRDYLARNPRSIGP